jgi:hypothetical protein
LRRLAERVLTALLGCAFLAGASPAPGDDDLHILRELRPAQRENLVLVQRDGSIRVISYDATTQEAQIAALPPERGYTVANVNPRAAHERPHPRMVAVRVQPHAAPHAQHVQVAMVPKKVPSVLKKAPPRIELAFVVPRMPGLLGLRDGRLFVPTQAAPKPAPSAAPRVASFDLAWLYAHRFDSTHDDRHTPGIPVRSQVGSPFDIDSGAFHGVRAVNGWSAVRVAVSIPCGARHFVTGPGYNEATGEQGIVDQETGYIYIGGWGAGPRGVSVDAGLQKSSAQSLHDDYAFYWKFASNKPITSEDRFPCGGPDVVLELYPVADSLLVFSVTGVAGDGQKHTFTAVQHTRPEDGWSPDGGSRDDGVILKRIVSIAQPWSWHRRSGVGRSDRFVSGSYFGVAGPHDLTPRIVWSRCEVGHVVPPSIVPQYKPWTAAQTWTSPVPGVYTDWPPLGVFRGSAGACDAAGIYLRA